jgi:acyl dehydratase
MTKRTFEDFAPGMVIETGPRLVTREEIVAFAAEFDPQPMHLDEDAARASILGGLAASGWHTCCLMMRMACDGFVLDSSSMGAPGVDEVKWLKPLRPGTSITLLTTVLEARTSKSRPEMGFVKIAHGRPGRRSPAGHDADDVDDHGPTRQGHVMKYFEDIRVGDRFDLGSYRFTAAEIKSFASRFDPQRFHMDEEEAKRSHFGALCASGWHTASVWMKLLVAYRKRSAEAARERGEPVAAIGPAAGFRNLKWLKPVYAEDTITCASEVIDTRSSASRPQWGLVFSRGTAINQHGEMVYSFESTTFIERRPAKP